MFVSLNLFSVTIILFMDLYLYYLIYFQFHINYLY